MKQYIDLHSHSTASDGTCTPEELLALAASSGITTLALTDHDTTAGLPAAAAAAEQYGIELIPGCELASSTEYGQVDILGLWVPEQDEEFEAALSELRSSRQRRNLKILTNLEQLGISITAEELAEAGGEGAYGRPHIASLMVSKGYTRSIREAFEKYLGVGRPGYAQREHCAPEKIVELLKNAGATVIIAHPLLIHAPFEWLEALVKRLIPAGLDGVEVYHSEHDNRGIRNLLRLAARHELVISGGSDFHGAVKPHISLGKGRGNLRIPLNILDKLKEYRHNLKLPL